MVQTSKECIIRKYQYILSYSVCVYVCVCQANVINLIHWLACWHPAAMLRVELGRAGSLAAHAGTLHAAVDAGRYEAWLGLAWTSTSTDPGPLNVRTHVSPCRKVVVYIPQGWSASSTQGRFSQFAHVARRYQGAGFTAPTLTISAVECFCSTCSSRSWKLCRRCQKCLRKRER